jgi:hypothetical protein
MSDILGQGDERRNQKSSTVQAKDDRDRLTAGQWRIVGGQLTMRYWWVNQNQTYRAEVRGSFMWSPKQNATGARNQFYENMRAVSPGDIVFSFCDTRIRSVGIITGRAQTGPKPDFGAAGSNWSREGWFVPVDYCELNTSFVPGITFR